MEIKVVNIGSGLINNYILVTDKGCIVVDTGFPGDYEAFLQKFTGNGFALSDVAYIFITHAHNDHVGFLKELYEATSVPVILNSETAQRLMEGMNRFIGGCPAETALEFCRSGEGLPTFPIVDVTKRAIYADKNQDIFTEAGIPAKILFLPGHTGDSIGILLDGGRLICGDAAMNDYPSTARHPVWIEDAEEFGRTWDKIMAAGVTTLYPGHGNLIPVSDLKQYRDFMKGKSLLSLQ